jgi:hypothetical protein
MDQRPQLNTIVVDIDDLYDTAEAPQHAATEERQDDGTVLRVRLTRNAQRQPYVRLELLIVHNDGSDHAEADSVRVHRCETQDSSFDGSLIDYAPIQSRPKARRTTPRRIANRRAAIGAGSVAAALAVMVLLVHPTGRPKPTTDAPASSPTPTRWAAASPPRSSPDCPASLPLVDVGLDLEGILDACMKDRQQQNGPQTESGGEPVTTTR